MRHSAWRGLFNMPRARPDNRRRLIHRAFAYIGAAPAYILHRNKWFYLVLRKSGIRY
jgi:hypothetical protein